MAAPRYEQLVEAAAATRFEGWDWRALRGRFVEQPPSWDYRALVGTRLSAGTPLEVTCHRFLLTARRTP